MAGAEDIDALVAAGGIEDHRRCLDHRLGKYLLQRLQPTDQIGEIGIGDISHAKSP